MAKLTFSGPTREADAEAARAAALLARPSAPFPFLPSSPLLLFSPFSSFFTFYPIPTFLPFPFFPSFFYSGISEAQLDAAVALLTPKRQRCGRLGPPIDRDSPFSSGLRTKLTPVPTPAAWNAIFLAAAALYPLTV